MDGAVMIRPADLPDAGAVAEVYLAARRAAVPAMPPPAHSEEEIRGWVAGRVGGAAEVWVAEREARVVGFSALTESWLDDLYVRPEAWGRGVGAALLDLAKSARPGGFALWVFESNEGARRFYRRHGLVELERTDGSANEERAPDIRMAWPGRDPMAYLRAEIDAVDRELADVLARRAALTAAVQRHKPVPGHAGRDPRREAEIVDRVSRRAPGLPRERVERIVHEVICAGLDAAEAPDPG